MTKRGPENVPTTLPIAMPRFWWLRPWKWAREYNRIASEVRKKWAKAIDAQRETEELLVMEQMAYSRLAMDAKVVGTIKLERDDLAFQLIIMPSVAVRVRTNGPPFIPSNKMPQEVVARPYSNLQVGIHMATLSGIAHLTREQAVAHLHVLLAKEAEKALDLMERDRKHDDEAAGREHWPIKNQDDGYEGALYHEHGQPKPPRMGGDV